MTKPKYAVCENCKQEMALGVACLYTHFLKDGKLIKRDTTNFSGDGNCQDCNAPVGKPHHAGCDNERCPICGRQFISCDCWGETIQMVIMPKEAL